MTKFLSPGEALALIRSANECHRGERAFPPEIIALQKKIADEIRNAELFILLMCQVDHGMVARITDMRLQLDALCVQWAEEKAA